MILDILDASLSLSLSLQTPTHLLDLGSQHILVGLKKQVHDSFQDVVLQAGSRSPRQLAGIKTPFWQAQA